MAGKPTTHLRPEAIIFIGIQATGKTTFYARNYLNTHLRINLDMLKTRHREKHLLECCLDHRIPFVIDNTNPTISDRARYISPALENKFKVIGYYFRSRIEEVLRRNELREGKERIPTPGILATRKKLELPAYDEMFEELYYVWINKDGEFVVEEWITPNEV